MPAGGQVQLDRLGPRLGLPALQAGALRVRPQSGLLSAQPWSGDGAYYAETRGRRDVPLSGGTQLDDLLSSRHFPEGSATRILVSPIGAGRFGAYATRIDAGTNDPTYFEATLISR